MDSSSNVQEDLIVATISQFVVKEQELPHLHEHDLVLLTKDRLPPTIM